MSVAIQLSPSPGFCIKSAALQQGVIYIQNEPSQVEQGFKIFVNIAWDKNVPPPPEGSEEDIRRAMQGQETIEHVTNGWFAPVVVSEGRKDIDKAGKPALVFDCVYNASLKIRTLADPDFKIFLIELALQRVEAQTSLFLSRRIGTPNISAKGKLAPRTVHVPLELFRRIGIEAPVPATATAGSASSKSVPRELSGAKKPLIEDITSNEKKTSSSSFDGKLKGILKSASTAKSGAQIEAPQSDSPLVWRWSRDGDKLRITIAVPNLTRDLIGSTTLDIEVRRLILNIPGRPMLDINLNLSDAEIIVNASNDLARPGMTGGASVFATDIHGNAGSSGSDETEMPDANIQPNNILMLKRQREFDVDAAQAEWRVADGVLVVFA